MAPRMRARQVAVEGLAVLVLTTGFVCLLFWRLFGAFGTTLLEPATDAPFTVGWLYALDHEGGYHLFGTTHHTLTGAPFGWDEANALNIQWLIPYFPGYLLTKLVGPLAAHNVVLLAGYVLSGASMYLLVRYIGGGRLVAAWSGLVYIVFPWHLMREPHPSLVHLEFFPLLLASLVAAARRPTWARFGLIAAATLACWLTSGYFGVMAVITTVAFAVGAVLGLAVRSGRTRFVALAGASTIAATVVVGVFGRAADVGQVAGLDRRVEDVNAWGLHLHELVTPAARNFVFGRWTEPFLAARQHASYPVETTNYLGILTLLLAAAWLVFAWRRRTALDARARLVTPAFTAVAVVALLFALPGSVSVFGVTARTPSWLLWEVEPAIRVPARWSVVVMTALVPLAALALQEGAAAAARFGRRWGTPALASFALVAAAAVVSFLELGFDPTTSRASTRPEPGEYAALARTPPGIVAEYPLVPNLHYFFWQSVHHRKLLNTSAFGSPADDAQHALVNPATPGTAEQLALLGVTAIVTHGDALRWSSGEYRPNPKDWGPGYRFIARSAEGSSTWQVVARPAPAFVSAVSGFGPPQALADGTPAFPLVSSSGVGYITIRARRGGVMRISFAAEPPTGKKVLRLADESKEHPFQLRGRTKVSVVVAVPRGVSLVLVKTDPPPTSAADAILLSRLQVEEATEPAELSALLEAPDPGF